MFRAFRGFPPQTVIARSGATRQSRPLKCGMRSAEWNAISRRAAESQCNLEHPLFSYSEAFVTGSTRDYVAGNVSFRMFLPVLSAFQ